MTEYVPSFTRDVIVFGICFIVLILCAFYAGRIVGRREGIEEGRNMAVVIAWGQAFRDGVAAGMSRAALLFHKLNQLPR